MHCGFFSFFLEPIFKITDTETETKNKNPNLLLEHSMRSIRFNYHWKEKKKNTLYETMF